MEGFQRVHPEEQVSPVSLVLHRLMVFHHNFALPPCLVSIIRNSSISLDTAFA